MKWGILITVVLIAILGGALVFMSGKSKTVAPATGTTIQVTGTPVIVSDDSLDKDISDVNTKLNSLSQDSVTIDADLNDRQGNLSEN